MLGGKGEWAEEEASGFRPAGAGGPSLLFRSSLAG